MSLELLTILATILPAAYYIYVGFRKNSRPKDLEDYFIYGKRVRAKDFANTSIGYSLQMAALFLFVDWGIRYGIGAFWVPLFWGLGFLLMYLAIPRLTRFREGSWTLHGYLRQLSGSRVLQVVAAVATIIGLWGTMMVEIDYATSVYQPFFKTDIGLYAVGITFLAFAFSYVAFGGYKAEVNTERIQVPVAYSTLLVVVLVLVAAVYQNGYPSEFRALVGILAVCFVLMIAAKARISPGHTFADRQIWIPIVGLIGLVVQLFVVPKLPVGGAAKPLHSGIFVNIPAQIQAQGYLSLLSLFVANSFWQFVDISSWQRISSVEVNSRQPVHHGELRRGLWRVMIESPVSWGFGVVFGMSLRYAGFLKPGEDASTAVASFVSALCGREVALPLLGSISWVVYPIFVAAVVAIMLSTVTALLSAITFTAFYDLPPFERQNSLSKARIYALGIAIVGAIAYYTMRHTIGIGIQSALYTFYSAQLSLLPTVIASLFSKRFSAVAALVSIFAGILATFASSAIFAYRSPDLALVPPLCAVVVSCIFFFAINLKFKDNRVK